MAFAIVCIAAALHYWQRSAHGATSPEVVPYTAHLLITRHQITSDGSRWDAVTTDMIARDRQGRIYEKDQRVFQNGGRRTASFRFFVQDPAKLQTLTWESSVKTVILGQWPYWTGRKGCWADGYGRLQARFPNDEDWHKTPSSQDDGELGTIETIEDLSGKQIKARIVAKDLGHKDVHGLTAYGVRWTTTPLQSGGTAALPEHTTELWKSRELNLKVLEVESGPKFGLKRLELSDLQRRDPDPQLFEPPQGYIVEKVEYHQVPCGQK